MKQYLDLLQTIMDKGVDKKDRTGIGTRSIFGHQMRFNLQEGFPLVTTKKVYLRSIIHELLWFLKGDTNIKYLVDNDVRIWNEWAFQVYLEKNNQDKTVVRYSEDWQKRMDRFVINIKTDSAFAKEYGDLGPVYGKQWMHWKTAEGTEINQIEEVINLIKNDPTSRRIIVCSWNVGEIQSLIHSHHHAPPLCHTLFQFIVVNDTLSCQLYQRSADTFLGVPFNIASYALLTMMMAQVTGLKPGDFIHTFGDAHIYNNHFDQVREQLSRQPFPLPAMRINSERKNISEFVFEDFTLENYESHPPIKAQIAV